MNITNMKVGDLIKPINGFRFGKSKMEIIQILPGRILVKYHNRSTLNREPLMSWEAADEYVVDVQRMREEKLNKLGI
jgi:hypothetical protein